MRLHRFISNFILDSGKIRITDEEIVNQARNVLRLKTGDFIILSDGNLNEAKARIVSFGKNDMEVEIMERYQNQNEPQNHVILYCAILKKENFELVVQKATEIGVREIVPIVTNRTIKLNLREDRLEKIAREASEQSGRGVIPRVAGPIDLEKAVALAGDNSNIIFDISGLGVSLDNSKRLNSEGKIGVWIGPEGGWTENEIELARRSNFKIITLGNLTLRAETAAIVACYMAIHS